ncbi:hypothetical protein NO2_1511, partial [Candidatus Termititenax persephonae]
GNAEKAAEIYNTLINNFNNRSITLCALDAPRTADGERPHYSVYIQEEAFLRLSFLTGEKLYLQDMLESQNSFGGEEHGFYAYARLARYNLLYPNVQAGSFQYYAYNEDKGTGEE